MQRPTRMLPLVAASLLIVAAPAAAQSPAASGGAPPAMTLPDGWTQVAGGLNAPRGVAIAADGTIYVAEAGAGGTDPCIEHPELGHMCFGTSGAITQVKDGKATKFVEGLPSLVGTVGGDVLGPSGVAVAADGTVWFLTGGPGVGAADLRATIAGGDGIGHLNKAAADGTSTSVADLNAFEVANNPDKDQPGNAPPDSNPNGLTVTKDGLAIVADAGGNDLLSVDASGKISVVTVFPEQTAALPPDPTASAAPGSSPVIAPMDPVPTSVVVGPDGNYYVGQLTGFPFPPGGAAVFKVVPGQDPVVYADGFTNVIGVAFAADGTLYVLEISHDGLLNTAPGGPPLGGLWEVPPGGGEPQLLATGLPMPGGIAVGSDGTIYVSTCASCPAGAGGLVSFHAAG
jgi:sugar lactone lactonase YvrE